MILFCCECQHDIEAVLVSGKEIYPHRKDLAALPYWQCPSCRNYVGCHHKTPTPTKPLGCIPNPEMRKARSFIHSILDPLWKEGHYERGVLYAMIKEKLGYHYHTAELRSIEEARKVYKVVKDIAKGTV